MQVAVSELKGHTASVLSVALDHTNNTSCIAAGAEGGTCPVRVWDTRVDGRRCQLAVRRNNKEHPRAFQGGVTSVAFAPGHLLFCSWEQSIAAYDLRRPDEAVIQMFDHHVWLLEDFADDEVNQISVSTVQPSGRWKIACCEDGGAVHVFQTNHTNDESTAIPSAPAPATTMSVNHTRLSGVHDNLCTAVRWQHGSDRIVLSGAMDSTICMWNATAGKPVAGGHIKIGPDTSGASTSGGAQLLNPPFVNSLDVSATTCAIGLGDGTIGLYSLKDQRPLGRLRGHDAATACVTFVRGIHSENGENGKGAGETKASCYNDKDWNYLFSAGNDRKICLWNLEDGHQIKKKKQKQNGHVGRDRDEDDWEDMCENTRIGTRTTGKKKKNRKKSKNKKAAGKRKNKRNGEEGDITGEGAGVGVGVGVKVAENDNMEQTLTNGGDTSDDGNEDHIPVRFEHPHKINWLDASRSDTRGGSNNGTIRLFVADASNSVTVYSGFV